MFTFEDVIGQERVKAQMKDAFISGQIPHAWLLTGPEGSGKMALALAFSRLLLCKTPQKDKPCLTCRSCKQMDKLVHPDLHFIFPFANRKPAGKQETSDDYIAAFRKMLLKSPYFSFKQHVDTVDAEGKVPIIYASDSDNIFIKLSRKSMEGGWKVVIIYLPERGNETFANKMLKLLEEPPERTLFMLLSTEPEKLLPTIRSRVQTLSIPSIKEEELSGYLSDRMGIRPVDAKTLAHMSSGSLSRVLEIMSLEEDSEENFSLFTSLMRLAYMRKLKELKAWSEQVASLGREQQKAFLQYAQRMTRESFIGNFHIDDLNYMTPQEQTFTGRFSPFINHRNVMPIQEELEKAQIHIEQNVNAKMVFFDLTLKTIMLLKQ